jgi:hypothetical protein
VPDRLGFLSVSQLEPKQIRFILERERLHSPAPRPVNPSLLGTLAREASPCHSITLSPNWRHCRIPHKHCHHTREVTNISQSDHSLILEKQGLQLVPAPLPACLQLQKTSLVPSKHGANGFSTSTRTKRRNPLSRLISMTKSPLRAPTTETSRRRPPLCVQGHLRPTLRPLCH